jgi:hypothetical protein
MAKPRNIITADMVETACTMIAAGKSLRAASREIGVDEAAIRYHLMKDEEAFSHSARARELGCDALADECLEIADDDTIKPDEKRVRIDTRIRLIGKWSQRYSDKVTVTNNSTVTHKYDLSSLGTAELEQLETLLAIAERGKGDAGEPQSSSVH